METTYKNCAWPRTDGSEALPQAIVPVQSNVGGQSGHEFCGGLVSRRAPRSEKQIWFPLR